jgi:hypothetical protein
MQGNAGQRGGHWLHQDMQVSALCSGLGTVSQVLVVHDPLHVTDVVCSDVGKFTSPGYVHDVVGQVHTGRMAAALDARVRAHMYIPR